MDYTALKTYLYAKYNNSILTEDDINFMFFLTERVYLSTAYPFDKTVKFDETDETATSWVTRAVMRIFDKGEFDIKNISENGLTIAIGTSMLNEITPKAGVV